MTFQQLLDGVEVLAQAGHLSSMERPAAFNTVVSEFLASLLYN